MRVVDYIAKRLAQETDAVFMLTGGGAMFLNDALSWCEGLTPVFCHHEQTCSMAAESYARFNQNLGVANVTTGPVGINAMIDRKRYVTLFKKENQIIQIFL